MTRTIVLRTTLASVIAIGAGCACAAGASAVASSSARPGPAGPPVAVQAPRDPMSKGSSPLSAATAIAMRNCTSAGPTAADAALASQLSPRISTDRMNGIDAGQVSCARVISQVVSDDGLASRAAVIAITTAITESTLHDYTQAVDYDSLGLYQQRPSQGWGTAAQVIDPTYATNKFLDVMQSDYPGGAWTTGDIGAICQRVQGSAFPAEYDKQVAAAQLIVNSLGTAPSAPAPSTPGLARFSGSAWTFYMYNYNSGQGVTDEYVTWPGTLASDKPLVGDWTGSGRSTPGLARFSGGTWTFYMYNRTTGPAITDEYVKWPGTLASDVPLVGDWTGSGKSTPGLARFSGGAWTFYMYNYTSGTGVTDEYVKWTGTLAGDVPLVGHWTGSGKTTPGLARFGGSAWTFYMYNYTSGPGITDEYVTWSGTLGSDKPLVGDWTGSGKSTPGLARFGGTAWTTYMYNHTSGAGVTDEYVTWPGTLGTDKPLVGNWIR